MLKGTTTTEFKPKIFFQGGLSQTSGAGRSRYQAQACYVSTLQSKSPKRFWCKKDLLKDNPLRSGSMNNTLNNPQENSSVSVVINTYIHVSHVINCSINQSFSMYSLSPPSNSALKWVQENLVPNTPPEHSSSTGRLCMVLTNWRQITSDPWVLEAIQGYKIKFWKQPAQACPPAPLHLSQKEVQLMNTNIHKLLEKRAIAVADPPHTQEFLSRVFLVPKKDGSQRPVINLRQLNQFVIWEHFKMESIHLVEHLIQEGKSRPQGCILFGPNSQGPSAMAPFSLARPELPVLLPSIRPVLSSPCVYEDHTPKSGLAEATGSEINCLHRRLLPFSFLQGGSPHTSSTHDHCIVSIGVLDQQREIHPNTLSGNGILMSDSSLSPPSSSSTSIQIADAKIQGPATTTQGCLTSDHYSKGPSPIYWDSQCCSSGNTTRPTILQVPPGIQAPFSETGGDTKQPSTPNRLRQGGAGMVERTGKLMEPLKPGSSNQLDKDQLQMPQHGVGEQSAGV